MLTIRGKGPGEGEWQPTTPALRNVPQAGLDNLSLDASGDHAQIAVAPIGQALHLLIRPLVRTDVRVQGHVPHLDGVIGAGVSEGLEVRGKDGRRLKGILCSKTNLFLATSHNLIIASGGSCSGSDV